LPFCFQTPSDIARFEQRDQIAWYYEPFAVPGKIFGLTLFLDFADRCTQTNAPPPATGSGALVWLPPSLRSVGIETD